MSTYKDFTFDIDSDGKCTEITGTNAIIAAVTNIILAKPGNFPLTPGLGLDVGKYMFEPFDDYVLSKIKTDIMRQVSAYVPDSDLVSVDVSKVTGSDGKDSLGITVSATKAGVSAGKAFLITKEDRTITVWGNEMPNVIGSDYVKLGTA